MSPPVLVRPTGGPPLEPDDYYGAVFAAIGVGHAPGDYAKSDSAKEGLANLKAYLKKTKAPNLHHKAYLLWASLKSRSTNSPPPHVNPPATTSSVFRPHHKS